MTLLELIQQTCNELGITPPNAVVTSTDPQVMQLYALLNRHGHDLSRQFEWEKLDKEYRITTVAFDITATLTLNSAVVTTPSTAGITTNFGVDGNGIMPFAGVLSVDSATQFTMNMPATADGSQTLQMSQVAYPLPSDCGTAPIGGRCWARNRPRNGSRTSRGSSMPVLASGSESSQAHSR
jgi:hypothetical protein